MRQIIVILGAFCSQIVHLNLSIGIVLKYKLSTVQGELFIFYSCKK